MAVASKIKVSPNAGMIGDLKVAICGEVSSGKSAVMQALLRTNCLPDFFGIEGRPVIRIRSGADVDDIAVFDSEGSIEKLSSLSEIQPRSGLTEIQVSQTELGPFGACELIEMPPLRDGFVTEEEIDRIASCDILIWVTIGSQAWRLSEKTILDEIGKRRPSQGILVVSRGDKFRSDNDRERLMDRMERETEDYFGARVLMQASPAAIDASESDDAAYAINGAESLTQALIAASMEIAGSEPLERDLPETSRVVSFSAHPMTVPEEEQPAEAELEETRPDAEDVSLDEPEETVAADEIEAEAIDNPVEESEPVPETVADVAPADPITEFLGTLHGVLAVGAFDLGNADALQILAGEAETASNIAQFCDLSAEALKAVQSFVEDGAQLESEHVTLQDKHILFRLDGDHALFLAGESAKLSTGIARTAFARLGRLYDTSKVQGAVG